MKTPVKKIQLLSAALVLWLAAMACNSIRLSSSSAGEMRTDTQSVESGAANSARVQIEMDAGKLNVQGGAQGLMEATFRYNVDKWKPQVSYTVNGNQGDLVVNQPNTDVSVAPNLVNEWTLMLNDSIPLDIEIRTGAGESVVDLSTVDLRGLQVETGAGNTDINLSGNWDQDINASFNGEVGAIKVRLPGEMGAQVTVNSGLVGVTASGLTKNGDTYVNQAFGSAPHTLYLDIQSGVGGIELIAP